MAEVKDKLITVESAKVIHDSLNEKFTGVVYSNEEDVNTSAETINADTLSGKPASDFATNLRVDALTYDDVGAAPSGFGLGKSAKDAIDGNLNNCVECGWYIFNAETQNTPFSYGVVEVIKRWDNECVQIAYSVVLDAGDSNYNGTIAKRIYRGSEWKAWEFINPPLHFGVEYRTIERHRNKAVYVTRLNLGALQNNGSTTGNLPSTPTEIVGLTGTIRSNEYTEELTFPVFTVSGTLGARLSKTGTKQILVKTFADYSAYTATVTVWYTKD